MSNFADCRWRLLLIEAEKRDSHLSNSTKAHWLDIMVEPCQKISLSKLTLAKFNNIRYNCRRHPLRKSCKLIPICQYRSTATACQDILALLSNHFRQCQVACPSEHFRNIPTICPVSYSYLNLCLDFIIYLSSLCNISAFGQLLSLMVKAWCLTNTPKITTQLHKMGAIDREKLLISNSYLDRERILTEGESTSGDGDHLKSW